MSANIEEDIRSLVDWFRRDIAFRAPELHDDAWAGFADRLVGIVYQPDSAEPERTE